MTTDLHDRLDDLVAEVPAYVALDGTSAWRAGRRRRTRRRVLSVASLVGAAVIVAGAVNTGIHLTQVEPADGGRSGTSATTHPTRIYAPLFRTGTLPDHPGPIAGLVRQSQGWLAIGQHGQVWRVPGATDTNLDSPASISPDGTRVAYVNRASGQSELTLLDLVHGGAFDPDIGGSGTPHAWLVDGPTYWSPDSARLLVPVRPGNGRPLGIDALVVTPGGPPVRVVAPEGRFVKPLGWLSPTRLGWLRWNDDILHPEVVITGVHGGQILRSAPAPGRIPERYFVNAAPLPSTDGLTGAIQVSTVTHQLLISVPGRAGSGVVAKHPISNDRTGVCPPSWTDNYPLVRFQGAPADHLMWSGPHSYVVQVDPALGGVGCAVWAYDAMRGHAYGGLGGALFGERTTWLSWHWRQVAIGLTTGIVVVAGWAFLALRRRRERRLPAV